MVIYIYYLFRGKKDRLGFGDIYEDVYTVRSTDWKFNTVHEGAYIT